MDRTLERRVVIGALTGAFVGYLIGGLAELLLGFPDESRFEIVTAAAFGLLGVLAGGISSLPIRK